jgi:hypothetical protein
VRSIHPSEFYGKVAIGYAKGQKAASEHQHADEDRSREEASLGAARFVASEDLCNGGNNAIGL